MHHYTCGDGIVDPNEGCDDKNTMAGDGCSEHCRIEQGFKCDETQLTRWKKGEEGIKVEKFFALMDVCGNDAPLLWMLHARGYDLASVRRRESELERENRLLREERAALLRALQGAA